MKRSLMFVTALMAAFAMPLAADARPHGGLGGGHHGIHLSHRGGYAFGHRALRGYNFRAGHHYWGYRGHWRGHRRYRHGRWWPYGVGYCWRWSPYYARFVWVCY